MKLRNYLDIEKIESLLEKYYKLTGLPGIIIDSDGKRIARAHAGNPLCVDFHWKHKDTKQRCMESDHILANEVLKTTDMALYKCKNGLYDLATRIMVKGSAMGTLYSGQFFIEKPDLDFFMDQAETYDFDKSSYYKAILSTPVYDIDYVMKSMEFLKEIAELIGDMAESHKRNREILESNIYTSDSILNGVIKNAPGIIFNLDKDGKFIFGEGLLLEKIGLKPNEFTGHSVFDIYKDNQLSIKNIKRALEGEKLSYKTEAHGLVFNTSLAPYFNQMGNVIGVVGIATDMTAEYKAREELERISFHDSLTNLYNRYFAEVEMKRLDTNRNLPFSIIMGDINGLKFTNDLYGHSEGDNLIKRVAEIMLSSTRSDDIVARWGGDEFVILLPSTDKYEARAIVERIYEKCKTEKVSSVFPTSPSIAIGIATKIAVDEKITAILSMAEDRMYEKKLLESTSSFNSILASLKSSLSQKSHETEEHAERLARYCLLMGRKLDFEINQLNKIELFAMLHDIGKITVDKSILMKKGKLDADEWDEIKKHSEAGFRIAQNVPSLSEIGKYILYHHEKYDGTGYPSGLKGKEIPLYCRILSIADAFDAMVSKRPYSNPMSEDEAIEEITNCSGTHFDPYLVEIFIEIMKKEKLEGNKG